MDYEEWVETYKPVKNHIDKNAQYDGTMFETYGPEREAVFEMASTEPLKVWTILSDDEDNWVISDGYHWVNRIGYFITELPFEDDELTVMLAENEPDEDEDEESLDYAIDN